MIIEKILSAITNEEEGKTRTSPLRMSSSGKCARQIGYQLHKFKGDPLSSRAIMVFRLGHTIETEVKALIVQYASSKNITFSLDPISFDIEGVMIEGHVDGFIENDTILEVKSINGMAFKRLDREGLSEEYKKQATSYMKATGRPKTLFVFYCKDTSHLKEVLFKYDEKYWIDVRDRFIRVIRSTPQDLPEREYGPNEHGKLPWQCSYCAYWKHCWPTAQLNFDKNNKPQLLVKEFT